MIITSFVDLDLPPDGNALVEKVLAKETTSGVLFDEICFTKVVFDERYVIINILSFESNLCEMRAKLRDDNLEVHDITTRSILLVLRKQLPNFNFTAIVAICDMIRAISNIFLVVFKTSITRPLFRVVNLLSIHFWIPVEIPWSIQVQCSNCFRTIHTGNPSPITLTYQILIPHKLTERKGVDKLERILWENKVVNPIIAVVLSRCFPDIIPT